MAQSVKYLSTHGQNQESWAQLQNLVTQHCVGNVDTRPLKLTGQPTLLSQCSPASLRDATIPKVRWTKERETPSVNL